LLLHIVNTVRAGLFEYDSNADDISNPIDRLIALPIALPYG
jgi:hypothetical protein